MADARTGRRQVLVAGCGYRRSDAIAELPDLPCAFAALRLIEAEGDMVPHGARTMLYLLK